MDETKRKIDSIVVALKEVSQDLRQCPEGLQTTGITLINDTIDKLLSLKGDL